MLVYFHNNAFALHKTFKYSRYGGASMSQSLAKFAQSFLSIVLAGALVFSVPIQGWAADGTAADEETVALEQQADTQTTDELIAGTPDATDVVDAIEADATETDATETDEPASVAIEADEPQSQTNETDQIIELTDEVAAENGSSVQAQTDESALLPAFVYFDQETITLGEEQLIALVADEESFEVASARLAFESPLGAQHIAQATTCAENAALFSLVPHELGIYTLLEAEFTSTSGEVRTMNLRPQTEEDGPCVFLASEPAAGVEPLAEMGEEAEISVYALDDAADAVVEAPSLDAAAEVADEAVAAPVATTSGAAAVASEVAAVPATASVQQGIATLSQVASPALEKAKRGETLVIALDPGHGGSDGGANDSAVSGKATVHEKNVTLKIAQYCKTALERYNVQVYMTRTTDEYVGLSERVRRAKSAGADVFISIHINSAASTSANGAEVWYPNSSSYRYDLHEEGKQLAGSIVKKLAALGLQNRGTKTLNATNGYTYPNNGGIGDYYTVIADAREAGMAGLIVEHAFISNASESAKLKQESFLKKLGEADAAGIAETYNLRVPWEQVNGKWRMKLNDGTYAKNCWQQVSGAWYWFDDDTYAATGWRTIANKKYYFASSNCAMVTGWQKISNKWYYFESSGAMHTGWLTLSGAKYYLDPKTGVMATGQVKIDGKVQTFDSSGRLQVVKTTGWTKLDNKWYYYLSGGVAKTGWLQLGNTWYWLDQNTGEMAEGKQKINGKWYYFVPGTGAMRAYAWLKLDNTWYWADSSGAFRENAWLQLGGTWYYLKANGVMATGWHQVAGKWYYFNTSHGAMRTYGWLKVNNDWFWIDSSGAARENAWLQLGGTWYYLKSGGYMATGWHQVSGKWYYFNPSNGAMRTYGWLKVNNDWFWIDSSGAARENAWLQLGGTWYYLKNGGYMATGWHQVSGTWYYFEPSNGAMVTGKKTIDGKSYTFASSGACSNPPASVTGGTNQGSNSATVTDAVLDETGNNYAIMGTSRTTVDKMVKYYNDMMVLGASKGWKYPSYKYSSKGAPTVRDFCQLIYDQAKAEGVRAEVLFAQVMLETNWLQFGGDVDRNGKVQCNFGGLGATGGGEPGLTFPNVKTGLLAQAQHLKGYASTAPLNQTCVDPRFKYLTSKRGSAPVVAKLAGTWAADRQYNKKLMTYIGKLASY